MEEKMSFIKRLYVEHQARKRVMLSRSRVGNFFVFLFLLLICAFMILPILYSCIQSLKPMDEIFAYPPKFFVRNPTFENFRQVFKLADNLWVPFTRYLFNSLFISVVGTGVYVIIASLAAYPLAKAKMRGLFIISQLIVWTLLFRPEVTAIPQYIIIAKLGLVDTYGSLILPTLASTMGVFLMKQFITASIPDSLLEAARLDGASEFRVFFSIVMPAVKPAWMTMIIFTFQTFWNNGGTQQYIYSESLKGLASALSAIVSGGIARTGAASAVSVIMMIPPIAVFIFTQSSVMETMTHSGLK